MENNAPAAAVQAKPSTSQFKENAMRILFIVCACVSILAVALICVFLFANGLPTIFEIGPLNFLLGTEWRPSNDIYGIFPMIVGSIYVTAGALVVGVPVGLLTAMYLSFFASERIKKILLPAIQLLAGIPSVVYGFFGVMVLVPWVAALADPFDGSGMSMFTASLVLGIMILPTIITVSKTSLDAVPGSYYEGSLALGATHERSVLYHHAACRQVRRAVRRHPRRRPRHRRTMAVIMVAGNQPIMPAVCSRACATMTSNIVLEMGYAHRPAPPGADRHRRCAVRLLSC